MGFPINPPRVALVNQQGIVTPEWYSFFVEIQKLIGTSQTNPFDDSTLLGSSDFSSNDAPQPVYLLSVLEPGTLAAESGIAGGGNMGSNVTVSLDQAFAPTWAAKHVFSLAGASDSPTIDLQSARPVVRLYETDAAADAGKWFMQANGGAFGLFAINDADTTSKGVLSATRSGNTITGQSYGNATDTPTHTFNGEVISTEWIKPASYTVAGVPSAATAGAGAIIYVSNESGGAVLAFSDAANWRRVTDRAVIS